MNNVKILPFNKECDLIINSQVDWGVSDINFDNSYLEFKNSTS
jgi:hypothetical protein